MIDSAKAELTPKHIALETHKKVKAEWELSGTCDWLLNERDFQSWEEMDSGYSFLWLHGRRRSISLHSQHRKSSH